MRHSFRSTQIIAGFLSGMVVGALVQSDAPLARPFAFGFALVVYMIAVRLEHLGDR